MRSTTLFGIYAAIVIALLCGMAGLTLYSLEKADWWEARKQLAQESYSLHLKLEANLYRLFKQHGDTLLIGERDGGEVVRALQGKIRENLSGIRNAIAREIQMVGEEEIEELVLLDEIEQDIRSVNAAIANLSSSEEPEEAFIQIERLAALLDGDIDDELDRKINAALRGELEEVEETLEEAEAFRRWNVSLVYVIMLGGITTLAMSLLSFNAQIRQPIIRLQDGMNRLRNSDYSQAVYLGGSREFRDLGGIFNQMGKQLAEREVSREEQKKYLEETVSARTFELQKMVDRLEIGEENRKRLMADISHELRTPLAIILGEADVTLRTAGSLSDDVSDAFTRIRDSAKHTNQIIDDMLTVARFEAGQLRLDRQETDLRKVVQDAVSMFPDSPIITLPETAVLARIDEVKLRQAVLALLQNARRYGGPTVSVDLHESSENIVIAVEDDGPGLSATEKSQAFERFFRGSNASGQGIEGNGLGLPVVKSIVEAHGGIVELQDPDDGGLRVVIELPKDPRIKLLATGT